MKKAIKAGQAINELEAIYLPLFKSKKLSPTALFLESAKLINAMQADDDHKWKVLALLITLAGKVAEPEELDKIVEEVLHMGNVIVEYFVERGVRTGEERGVRIGEERGVKIGEERGSVNRQEQIARKMMERGICFPDIIDLTGIDEKRIHEIHDTLHV